MNECFPRLSEGGEGIVVVLRMDEVEQGTSLRHRDVKQANWLSMGGNDGGRAHTLQWLLLEMGCGVQENSCIHTVPNPLISHFKVS